MILISKLIDLFNVGGSLRNGETWFFTAQGFLIEKAEIFFYFNIIISLLVYKKISKKVFNLYAKYKTPGEVLK